MAWGMESPTINRNAGKTTSASHIPSSFAALCSSHPGISVSDQRSFTKIISSMVNALRISIDFSLFEAIGIIKRGRKEFFLERANNFEPNGGIFRASAG